MPLTGKKKKTEFNPHTIIIPPGRCPSASPGGILRFCLLTPHSSGKQQRVGCFFRWVGNSGWSPRELFPIRSFPGPGLPENGFTDLMPIFPISDANVCNPSRKRLQPPSQTFATPVANVCTSKTPKNALSGPPRQKCQDDTIRKPSSACRAVAIT